MERTFLASELITRLHLLINRYGDLPVIAFDPDTCWRLEIGVVYVPADTANEYPERFEIQTEYNGRPDGNVDDVD